jgi:hypothetical protein
LRDVSLLLVLDIFLMCFYMWNKMERTMCDGHVSFRIFELRTRVFRIDKEAITFCMLEYTMNTHALRIQLGIQIVPSCPLLEGWRSKVTCLWSLGI